LQHLSPEASAAVAAASAALEAFAAPRRELPRASAVSSPTSPPGPRKLIDLFPPARPAAVEAKTPAAVQATAPVAAAAATPPAQPARVPALHERFYGLSDNPFDLAPDPRFHFRWDSHDQVLRDLTAAFERRDGTMLLIGNAGSGKTTVCRALAARLGRRTLVCVVGEPPAAARDLLQTVLADFGVVSRADTASGRLREASRDDLVSALRDFLASLAVLQAVALIVIDDAHAMAPGVLADLQILADMALEHKRLQVLLVGEPPLRATLQRDSLRKWDGLIGLRAELGPLAGGDMADYVTHRLAVVGTTDRLFDEAALARVHTLSHGTPRTVNRLCDRALTMGQRASARSIDEALVDRAARDLGLIADPAPPPSWRRRFVAVIALLVLMCAGAAGAGWIFREPLTRTLARWHVLPGG
jgi:general secretion pathway protein A